MNEVFTGGLGSFSVVCLVLSYLKFYPKIFYEKKEDDCQLPENLGTLLINFLYLFGGGFDYENIGISVNDGTFYRKMDKGFYNFKQRYLLSLEDPIMAGNDLTKGSHRISEISYAWKQALNLLRKDEEKDINKVKKNQPSLLAKILFFDNDEIRRRRQIREYIYPKVIQRTGDRYTTTPESSENEEETPNNNNNNNNKENTNTTNTNHHSPLDNSENESSRISYDEIAQTINNNKSRKRKADVLNIHAINTDNDDDDDDDDNDDNDDTSDDDASSTESDKDNDEYIPVNSEEEFSDSSYDPNGSSSELSHPPLNDDDEIYEYASHDDDDDDENSEDNDEEYDEYIARQEDDELDEEEFDSDLYNKLGENFLDEDNIDIDDILYK